MSEDSRHAESEDPWPDEPDDPFAERYERQFQPDEGDLAPDPPSPEEIPPEVRRTFWSLVGAINVGLLGGSLGVMLVVFRGEWLTGAGLVVVGLGALAWSVYRYRAFQNRDEDDDPDATRGPNRKE